MNKVVLICVLFFTSLFVQASTVTYELTIQNDWTRTNFPANYPAAAHFSHLGGATHNSSVSFWDVGQTASPGMVKMAETGVVSELVNNEVQNAINAGTANSSINHEFWTPNQPATPPGSTTITFQMDSNFSLFTLVSMLGPSPDWFIGVSGLDLMPGGQWLDNYKMDLLLYDGGTESATIPIMNGPKNLVPKPIGYVRYDSILGEYITDGTTAANASIVGSFEFKLVTVPAPKVVYLFSLGLIFLVVFRAYSTRRNKLK